MLSAPLSICHVVAPAEVGGLESVVGTMAAGQRRVGHSVVVAAMVAGTRSSSQLQDGLRAAGVEVVALVCPGRRYVAQWSALCEVFRRRAPSVVHTHGYRADVIGGLAARRLGLPTVATVHGFTGGDLKNRLYQNVQRRALRRFDAVMPVARTIASDLAGRGIPRTKLHVIPNGFTADVEVLSRADARRALALGAGELQIGWIGRLSAEKGPDLIVRAIAMLPAVRLSVLGDGVQRAALRALAERLGVDARINWHGVVPAAARFLAAFDVVVLSSRSEGTPVVLLEAMAAGTPVVATRVGGVPDMVTDTEAIIVEPDNPEALADAIAATLRDPAAAAARAAAARRRLGEAFGVGPWLARVDAVYASVLRAALPASRP